MIIVITIADIIFNRDIKESLLVHGVSYVLIAIIFYFQKTHYYTLARVLFLCSIIGITFVFANFTTPLSLIENFYFIYPLAALILIDKKWINFSILLLCFLLYFFPNLYFNHYPKDTILPVLVFSVFLATFVILHYSQALNKKSEKELEKNKNKLEQAYLELEERKKSELAQMQLKSLKAQMNPHFMFNAINSIQNLILKDNKQEAYNYLTKFSTLLRDNLKTSEKSFIDFTVELSMLQKYLELEKLRFGKDFEFKILGVERIESMKIPSMVIQSFIENAIRYRLLHKEEGVKKLTIEFFQEDVFKCVITDNGIGIKAATEMEGLSNSEEHSFSVQAIRERLALLEEHYKVPIEFSYEEIEQKTSVIVKTPYLLKYG